MADDQNTQDEQDEQKDANADVLPGAPSEPVDAEGKYHTPVTSGPGPRPEGATFYTTSPPVPPAGEKPVHEDTSVAASYTTPPAPDKQEKQDKQD